MGGSKLMARRLGANLSEIGLRTYFLAGLDCRRYDMFRISIIKLLTYRLIYSCILQIYNNSDYGERWSLATSIGTWRTEIERRTEYLSTVPTKKKKNVQIYSRQWIQVLRSSLLGPLGQGWMPVWERVLHICQKAGKALEELSKIDEPQKIINQPMVLKRHK